MNTSCKKYFVKLTSVFLSSLFAITAYAQPNVINIVNHFNQPLTFQIQFNPQVLPDLSTMFTLAVNGETSSHVVDSGKKAIINVTNNDSGRALWSVTLENRKVKVSDLLQRGIAFSTTDQTITFCTPEIFDQNGSC